MSWLKDLVATSDGYDVGKILALFGCVAVVLGVLRWVYTKLTWWCGKPRVRLREFGCAQRSPGGTPIPFVDVQNAGRQALDIACARLCWPVDNRDNHWDLLPDNPGSLQPKTALNRYADPARWATRYWVDERQLEHVEELISILNVDVRSWRFEVYVEGQPRRPVKLVRGHKLDDLRDLLVTYGNEPARVG
jgi:hypothetical protein